MSPYNNFNKYLYQARKNEELVFYLHGCCKETKIYLNWIFVVIYYTAYHYFCAFLASKNMQIPDAHKGRNDKEGELDMVEQFYTQRDGITHAAADDYKQLYQWSWDVRYRPERENILRQGERETAINFLRGIKLITFNEVKHRPRLKQDGKIEVEDVRQEEVGKLLEEYKSKQNIRCAVQTRRQTAPVS